MYSKDSILLYFNKTNKDNDKIFKVLKKSNSINLLISVFDNFNLKNNKNKEYLSFTMYYIIFIKNNFSFDEIPKINMNNSSVFDITNIKCKYPTVEINFSGNDIIAFYDSNKTLQRFDGFNSLVEAAKKDPFLGEVVEFILFNNEVLNNKISIKVNELCL